MALHAVNSKPSHMQRDLDMVQKRSLRQGLPKTEVAVDSKTVIEATTAGAALIGALWAIVQTFVQGRNVKKVVAARIRIRAR